MKKVVALTMAAALLGTTLLTGCGSSSGGSGNNESGENGSSDENVTLRFSWWGGDERHEATLAVIEAYEKEHPNITIEAEYSSADGYAEKKTTEFASGTALIFSRLKQVWDQNIIIREYCII